MNKKKKTFQNTYLIYYLPVAIVLLVLPLLVMRYDFIDSFALLPWNDPNQANAVDIFLHVKNTCLYVIMGMMIFITLCYFLMGRRFSRPKMILSLPLIYLAFAFFSAIASEDHQIAVRGASDLFQGLPVLTGYVILFYYTYFFTRQEERNQMPAIRFLLRTILIFSLVIGVIGILQFTGHDPFRWSWVIRLCHMEGFKKIDTARIYLTSYHADYAGVLILILLPFQPAGVILSDKWEKILFIISAGLLIISLIATRSRTSIFFFFLLCLVCSMIILWHGFRSGGISVRPQWVLAAAGVAAVIVLSVFFNDTFRGGNLHNRLFHFINNTRSGKHVFHTVETKKDCVMLDISGKKIYVSWKNEETFSAKDTNENHLKTKAVSLDRQRLLKEKLASKIDGLSLEKAKFYSFAQTDSTARAFENIVYWWVQIQNENGSIGGYAFFTGIDVWFFTNQTDDGSYQCLNQIGRLDQSVNSSDAFPDSAYGLFSYRGYIWSKTLPLLKKRPLLGSGPDQFETVFPNNDYSSKLRIRQENVIYNKPHSWYLQMAAETGIPSALCMIIFLIWYLTKSLRQIIKKGISRQNIFFSACVLSVLGYVLTGLLNDSMVCTAPLFWVILGLGCAL